MPELRCSRVSEQPIRTNGAVADELPSEQHRILNEANTLQKQEYANLDQQYRQLQGALNQAQNERKSVSLDAMKLRPDRVIGLRYLRHKSRSQEGKRRWTDCAMMPQTCEQKRSNGR